MFIRENFMHVIFSLLLLSLFVSLNAPQPPPLQVCNVNIKKSTFSLECCRQSVSGRVQSLQGVRALWANRQTKLSFFFLFFFLCLTIKNSICIYWKSKIWRFVHSYVCGCSSLHTQTHTHTLYYTQNTNTSCI